ncbi:MAG: FTR1 family protein [Gemmatimonadales bacterium]
MATPNRLGGQEDVLRRIATVSSIAIDEYGLGVVDGVVVSAAELDEAVLFLEEALRAAGDVRADELRTAIERRLEALLRSVRELEDRGRLAARVAELRGDIVARAGITLDVLPTSSPSLRAGELAYREACASCHGLVGAGDGVAAVGIDPPPADLTDYETLRSTSPLDFHRILDVGVAGTAMQGFGERYAAGELWALSLYASSLRGAERDLAAGREWLQAECVACLIVFSGPESVTLSDDSLLAVISTESGADIDSELSRDLVAYARVAAAVEELGANRAMTYRRVARNVRVLLERARGEALAGDVTGAVVTALDAYLEFEKIEAGIRARDPVGTGNLEAAFSRYRGSLATASPAEIDRELQDLKASLSAGVESALAVNSPSVLFGKSVLILLREGLEAILIVAALTAFLVRSGHDDRKRDIGVGIVAAIVASVATATVFATVLRGAVESQEMVEGITMLIGAAVLFWVSYWLVSKVEMRKWQQFVHVQMARALSSGSRFALAFVAFLAVYREGFETVLFYAALFASTDGSAPAAAGITSGIVVAFGLLVVVYVVIQRYGLKIPLKQFFGVTSALLYVMAFSFAGQGIAELQESGYVAATPVGWVPTIPLLGIFPTAQTVSIQAALAFAILAALAWVFWLSPRFATAETESA